MYPIISDRALILSLRTHKEHDGYITAFSWKHGIIGLIVTGIKRPLSKLRAHIQVGTLCEISWVVGATSPRLVGAMALQIPTKEIQKHVHGFIRYVHRFVPPGHVDEQVTELIQWYMKKGERVDKDRQLIATYRLFQLLGYVPPREFDINTLSIPESKELMTAIKQAVTNSHL